MRLKVSNAPYIHTQQTVSQIMRQVLYALIPAIFLYVWFFGWGIILNIIIASAVAVSAEAWVLWLRAKPIRATLQDNSALVMACLFALSIPPFLPWWMTVIGASFGIIFAKQLYGGLGYNNFNPAMVGYAVLLISFPIDMTHWPALSELSGHPLSFWDSLSIIFTGQPVGASSIDALSGATPLDTMKTALKQYRTVHEIKAHPLFGDFGARGWEWMGNAFFLGGCWLIYKRVITWHIPAAVLGSLFSMAAIFFLIDPDRYPSPLFHLFSGAAMLCAFFIATDPVSAATSNKGRLIFGAGIGMLIYIIRTWGGYPDGVAFAVLLMNLAAPTLDYFTKPRLFGQKGE
jgi:electron transport complex protein RnfD